MADLTIDELAARTGTKSSTIRMYQNQGLLPPPEIHGRVGFYGDGHLARLDLIARLQERGYTLAAIKELVESWERGRDLGALLGLERAVAGAHTDRAVRLTFTELARYFPDTELDARVMQRAVALGLVAIEPDGVRVAEPRFLQIGSELVAQGLTPAEVLDEWERVDGAATALAQQFRATFERHVWQPFVAAGMPAAELESVTATLEHMQALGSEIVAIALRRAIATATEQAVAAAAETAPRPAPSA